MAPEQIRGEVVDARADVYAVACIVVEMLRGRPLFVGSRREEILAAQLAGRHAAMPAALPPAARDAVERALSVDAARRPSSAAALRRALLATSLSRTVPASTAEPRARSRAGLVLGVVAIAAFVAGVVIVREWATEPERVDEAVPAVDTRPAAAASTRPRPIAPPRGSSASESPRTAVESAASSPIAEPAASSASVEPAASSALVESAESSAIAVEPPASSPSAEPSKQPRRARKRLDRDAEPGPAAPPEPKPKRALVDGIRDPFAE
jgi:serine/threonine-protein kinase